MTETTKAGLMVRDPEVVDSDQIGVTGECVQVESHRPHDEDPVVGESLVKQVRSSLQTPGHMPSIVPMSGHLMFQVLQVTRQVSVERHEAAGDPYLGST